MAKVSMKDAVVFITGTNKERGIGRALVEEAIRRGAKKVYATARDISQLQELCLRYPGVVVPLRLDVTNPTEVDQVARTASDTQILINNSGSSGYSGFCFSYNEEAARKELEVNYFGTLKLIRAFSKALLRNGNAAIVNVLSIGGLAPYPLCGTYSASKAAAHSMTQSVRAELSHHGVSVFGIYPGPIDTEMADGVSFEKQTPASAVIRIFDGMEQGSEDITTDAFADTFVENLRLNPKGVEKGISEHAHKMPEDFWQGD